VLVERAVVLVERAVVLVERAVVLVERAVALVALPSASRSRRTMRRSWTCSSVATRTQAHNAKTKPRPLQAASAASSSSPRIHLRSSASRTSRTAGTRAIAACRSVPPHARPLLPESAKRTRSTHKVDAASHRESSRVARNTNSESSFLMFGEGAGSLLLWSRVSARLFQVSVDFSNGRCGLVTAGERAKGIGHEASPHSLSSRCRDGGRRLIDDHRLFRNAR
jgi:hypothetical protein